MTRPNLRLRIQRSLSLTGALVGLVPLFGSVDPFGASTANSQFVLLRMASADTHTTTSLQSAQQSVASNLQEGFWVGRCRLKINVTPSNVGISWQLPL